MYQLYNGDCLQILPTLPDQSIDLILTDLPYGTTQHGWDSIIPFGQMWQEVKRILKADGIAAFFACQPFTSNLIMSQPDLFRYCWLWNKGSANNFLNCNSQPLKITEDICIFSAGKTGSNAANKIRYKPQGIIEVNRPKRNKPNSTYRKSNGYTPHGNGHNLLNSDKPYTQKYTNYPTNILCFDHDQNSVHPTQKPVKLLEYLILTYTDQDQTVLDFTAGSGSTGIAAQNTGRNFIGIELDKTYFDIMEKRIKDNESNNKTQ